MREGVPDAAARALPRMSRRLFLGAGSAVGVAAVVPPVVVKATEPPADPWGWYFSDDQERFEGPFETRGGAIEEARETYEFGAGFEVMEARPSELSLTINANNLIDIFQGQNEDIVDPDGDYLGAEWNPEQCADLERSVNAAITAWAQRHNIDTRGWYFAATRNREDIEPLPISAAVPNTSPVSTGEAT